MKETYEEIYLSGSDKPSDEKSVSKAVSEFANDKKEKDQNKPKAPQPVGEIVALRGPSHKVFRMSDGTEKAVLYAETKHVLDKESNQYKELNTALDEDNDNDDFCSKGCGFVARFSKDKSDEKLFSIEKDGCSVTAYAKRPKKSRAIPMSIGRSKDAHSSNKVTVKGMCDGTDVEYSVIPDGIKENIVISKKREVYRYPFELVCENVTAKLLEDEKQVVFCRQDNGEEVFKIPTPYMFDAKGARSYDVTYDMKEKGNGVVGFTVTADSDWINADERVFPVTVDPQIVSSNKNANLTTYGWKDGSMTYLEPYYVIGNDGSRNRMYMTVGIPELPHNAKVKSVRLTLKQNGSESEGLKRYEVYRTDRPITVGTITPEPMGNLLGYWTSADLESGAIEVDITPIMDCTEKVLDLVVKKSDDSANADFGYVQVHGERSEYKPSIAIYYEPSYNYDSGYASHTHDLGPLGQGIVDLATGNLHINAEDFSWAGNRMPVTIRHMYNSALSDTAYTNGVLSCPIGDFSAMKLGNGWKLNLMQSVAFDEKSGTYIYTDENCNHIELEPETKDGKKYFVADDISYDPAARKLTMGDDVYTFDEWGRLTAISDGHSVMTLHYMFNMLTAVADGVDREFGFAYNANGYLASITAPDGTSVSYTYAGDTLTGITYPSGKRVEISYRDGYPSAIVTDGSGDSPNRSVNYTFTSGKVTSVTEQGTQDGETVLGATADYSYSVGSRRTTVTACDGSGEPAVHTVYAFDTEGDVLSKYSYTEKEGNSAVTGESAGIDPYTGEDAGVASNVNNLLRNHDFADLSGWTTFGGASATVKTNVTVPYGRHYMFLTAPENCEGGAYQQTVTLPASDYTLSAYLRPNANTSVRLRVTDIDGRTLAESERLTRPNFIRLDLPFTLNTAKAVRVGFVVTGGSASINAPQLENNPVMNEYNHLENGNFELGGEGWTLSGGASITDEACFNMGHALRLNCGFDTPCTATQTVHPKPAIGTRETFTLSGWAKGRSVEHLTVSDIEQQVNPVFRLRAVINYVSGSNPLKEEHPIDFSPQTDDWQFVSLQFSKAKYQTIESITISCEFDQSPGVAYFDDLQLIRNSIETGLTKDDIEPPEEENNTSTEDTTEQEDTFTEAEDAYGNTITQTQRWKQSESVSYAIYTSSEFTPSSEGANAGNDLVRQTDSRGFNTYYDVDDETSRNMTVTDRCGNKTSYEYDDSGRTTKVTSRDSNGTALAHVDYGYDLNDNLVDITRGDGMSYNLAYNSFNRLESIAIDGMPRPLVAYNYKEGSGRLKEIEYANGSVMHVSYNRFGHPIREFWTDSCNCITAFYRYVYDNSGNLVRSVDFVHKIEYTYTYEEGKIVRSAVNEIEVNGYESVLSRTLKHSILYFYDDEGRLEQKVISDDSGQYSYTRNSYDENGNVSTVAEVCGSCATITSATDGLGRKTSDSISFENGVVTRDFHYRSGAVTQEHIANNKVCGTATTNLVSKIHFSNGRVIEYWYDGEERITRIADSCEGETFYTYDALGQLTSETKNVCPECCDGETVNITYDNYGNILTKGEHTYGYNTSHWKDKLISFDGKLISYDPQGNPLNYLGHALRWGKGRQLKSFDNNTYTYNSEGVRISKTVDNVRHDYVVDGGNILKETWQDNVLVPIYNNDEEVVGIHYNCEPYYFYKNLQGDVIGVADADGTEVVTYTYDAWGVCTVLKDISGVGLANINPYRYRSYYYDTEIGMYYLQSRYYDPVVGRFVNADEEKTVVFTGVVQINNLFCYCENNPINVVDDSGMFSFDSIKKSIKKCVSNLFDRFVKYLSSLIVLENGFLIIKTVVITSLIDSILFLLGSVASFLAKKAIFKIIKSILFKNKKTTSEFMGWILDLWRKINLVRLILWAVSTMAKTHATRIKGYLSDFTQNLLKGKCKIVDMYFKIVSLTSFSGIIALIFDIMDGFPPDDKIAIRLF